MLIFFLFCMLFHTTQASETVLEYDDKAQQDFGGQVASVLEGYFHCMPSAICNIMGSYLESGDFVQTGRMKDPAWFISDKYLTVTYVAPHIVAAGTNGGDIHLWDVDNNKLLAKLKGHKNSVGTLAYHSHSNQLISGSDNSMINDSIAIVWDVESQKLKQRLQQPYQGSITTVAFLNLQTVVFGGPQVRIQMIDLQNKKQIFSEWQLNNLHPQHITPIDTRKFFVIDGNRRHSEIIDLTGFFLFCRTPYGKEYTNNLPKTSVVTDTNKLVVSNGSKIDVIRLSKFREIENKMGHKEPITAMAKISTQHILTTSRDHTMRIWDVEDGCSSTSISISRERGDKEIISLAANDEGTSITAAIAGSGLLRTWRLGIK